MARNPKFDEARRKLDAALGELDGEAGAPGRSTDGADAVGGPPARPGQAARVASPRRRAALPPRAGRPASAPVSHDGDAETVRIARGAGANEPAPPRIARGAGANEPMPPGPVAPEVGGAARGAEEPSAPSATPPTTEALARLVVGAALLGLDGLAARSARWEAQAGIGRPRGEPPAADGAIGSARFRHALIGWIFEAEEQLRPRGNPIVWLRAVVAYAFGTVFSVVLELLPLPRRGRGARAEPSDEETRRWARRGQAEEERSRRVARVAIADMTDAAILAVVRRPAMGQALRELARSPAMDDAVRAIVAGPVIDEAITRVAQSPTLDTVVVKVAQSPALDTVIAQVAQSPAIEQAVTQIVRTPAMEDAVRHIVGTKAMNEAIETLSKSPALVDLVTTQSTSVAFEVLGEVRERAVSADKAVEAIVRRILRRTPRARLPLEARGMPLRAEPAQEQSDDGV